MGRESHKGDPSSFRELRAWNLEEVDDSEGATEDQQWEVKREAMVAESLLQSNY